MRSVFRSVIVVMLMLIAFQENLFSQAAEITGWRNSDFIYCSTEEADTLYGASPPGKPFYFDGVSYLTSPVLTRLSDGVAIFNPSLTTVGDHSIVYGTIGSHDVTVIVSVVNASSVSLSAFASVCSNEAAFSLFNADSSNVSPKTGTFSGPGVSANVFDPAVAGVGTHTVTYTVSAGSCTSSASRTITVLALPTVGIDPFSPVCEGSGPITLTEGYPAGGTYSGPGVTGTSFDPATTGIGTFTLYYTYTNSTCSNTASRDIVVSAKPSAGFSGLAVQYCSDDLPVNLTGSPLGITGVFEGSGVTSNGDGTGIFDPSASGLGLHEVSYIYTNVNGCSDTATQSVQVGTDVNLDGLSSAYCINGSDANITGSPLGGTYAVVAGLTDNGDGTAVFSPSTAGVGMHTISYSYLDTYGCLNTINQTVQVYALPVPAISNLLTEYCYGSAAVTLTGNYAPAGTFSGSAITDLGNGTATFQPASLPTGGPYNVIYSYQNPVSGCQASVTRQVLINPPVTATISGDVSVCQGIAVPIDFTFSGTSPYDIVYTDGIGSYTENNIAGPTHSVNVVPADTATYQIVSVTDAKNCTTTGTGSATINVNPEVTITLQPASEMACLGDNVQFEVAGTGTNVAYQWQKDGVDIAGATAPMLALNNVQAADAALYRCVVSGDCGPAITSNEASLSFWTTTSLISNPSDAHECEGEDISFSVSASGSNLSYQWYKDNLPVDDTGGYSGTHTNTIVIQALTPAKAGDYHAVITGNCGTVTSNPAVLEVDQTIVISSQPVATSGCAGESASFSIVATGDNLTYQWTKDGLDIAGETGTTLAISTIALIDEGFYRCVVTSGCGSSVVSHAASLTVDSEITILSNPVQTLTCEGDEAILIVNASGTGLAYQWKKDGVDLTDNLKITGSQTASLVVHNTEGSDQGSYQCELTGNCGSVNTTPVTLEVDTALAVTTQPQDYESCPGDNVYFSITATGNNISYQWRKDGVDIAGENSSGLAISDVEAADEASYTCIISNTCGKSVVSDPAVLSLLDTLRITLQPVDLQECSGNNAFYTVQATGSDLSYTWEYNGSAMSDGGNITGSHTNTLFISKVTESNEGVYNCYVTGSCGSERSEPASLLVNDTIAILSQPAGDTVCEGMNTDFRVVATGAVNYQWQKDKVNLAGENSPILAVSSVTVADSGVYRCLVYSLCDTLASDGAYLNIKRNPAITQHPTTVAACENETVQFTVQGTGDDLSYAWYYNGTLLSDGSGIQGSATQVLKLDSVTTAQVGVYHVELISSCGTATSNDAVLSVTPALQITSQPQAVSACEDQNVSFSVVVSGPASYQWQKDNADLPGQTGSSLVVSNVTQADEGSYRCRITGPCGDQYSNGAALVVTEATAVTSSSSDITTCQGQTVAMSVTALGEGLAYQWKYNGSNLSDGSGISGSSTADLSISSISQANSGVYQCLVTGSCGTDLSDPATITVNNTISISIQPQSRTICSGQSVSFNIQATGSGLNYQWQKNGTDIAGADQTLYTISTASISDTGVYRCVVTNACGSVTSQAASLDVETSISITSQPQPTVETCPDNTVVLQVGASGTNLNYQWYLNGSALTDNDTVQGSLTSGLTLYPVAEDLEGIYMCVVNNSCFSTNSGGSQLSVDELLSITEQPQDINTCTGEDVSFAVNASGTILSYQWQKGTTDIAGETGAALDFTNVAQADTGLYRCMIYSLCDTLETNPARLDVSEPLVIVTQPVGTLTRCEGMTASFSIGITGSATAYQWKRNGTNLVNGARITGAQSPNLMVTGLTVADAGVYTCTVTGACNTLTSTTAQLNIEEQPSIVMQPADYSILTGGDASFTVSVDGSGLSYQWYFEGSALADGGNISGSATNHLDVTGVGLADEGAYHVVADGSCGSVTSNVAMLTALSSSVITGQPSGDVVCEGESMALTVTASGSGNTYQWEKNGTAIADDVHFSGSQQNTLTISDIRPEDAGSYSCLVNGTEHTIPALVYVNQSTQITLHPFGADLCEDEAYTMLLEVSGDSLEYQWLVDGSALSDGSGISGSDTAVLSLNPLVSAHSGSYTCEVTGECGTAVSDPAVLTVSIPVEILVQPADVTLCEGQNLNLDIQVSGTGAQYQWYKNGSALVNDGRITGVNSSVLVISNAVTSDQGAYSCVVTGNCNAIYSAAAYATVLPALSVTAHPSDVTTCNDETAVFIVAANTTAVDYQWQKDGTDLVDGADIAGSATSVLQLDHVTQVDEGVYRCVISGSCDTLTSQPATLTVNNEAAITGNPVSDTICEGASHTFSITASGDGITYQWMKDGLPLSEAAPYSGTQTANLVVSNATTAEAGAYYCRVSNSCRTVETMTAMLQVFRTVSLSVQPEDLALCEGEDLSLVTIATGSMITYQWEKDNNPLADGGTVSGSATNTLIVDNSDLSTAGTYRCVVTGYCNTETSDPALVTVAEKPAIAIQPVGQILCEGENLTLDITATGDDLSYQWKKNGQVLTDNASISGSATASLYIQSVDSTVSGAYTCEVTSTCGWMNSDPAVVVVYTAGVITHHPEDISKCEGDAASFYVTAHGTGLAYQWEYEGTALTDDARISGSTTSVLTVADLVSADMGTYRCVISDSCGSVLNTTGAVLTVFEPLVINSIPAGDTLCEGSSITLNLSATGDNLTYQWYRNDTMLSDGTGITGSTTSSLILNNITKDRSGYYYALISGSCNSEVTNVIPVMVYLPVSISDQPDNLTRCAGETALFSLAATGDSLSYQWEKDGTPLSNNARINGSNSSLLVLTDLTIADAGSYQCVVTGICGDENSTPAVLTMNGYPSAAGLIQGDTVVCQGAENVIYVVPDIPGADSYQWSLPPGVSILSGNNTREIEVAFASNELGGPISVAGVNGCGTGTSSDLLYVTANPVPIAYAGENTGVCSDQTELNGYIQDGLTTGMWQVISGPAVLDDPLQAQTAVTNLRMGDNKFSWTVTRKGCSTSDTITIMNNMQVVEAGTDTSVCDHVYYLDALPPTYGTGEWSILAGSGYNISRNDPNSIVSGLSQGLNTFKWSVNYNGCVSSDTVNITNNMPTTADAGYDQSLSADYTNLSANDPAVGTGEWSLLSGSAVIEDETEFNTLVTGLGKGSNIFEWTITHVGCISSDTVIIENILADSTDAGPNQIICSSSVRLEAKDPYPGYGEWSVRKGSASFDDNSQYNTLAYNLAQGENVLIWTAYLNGTTSDSVVIVNNMPTTANAGVNLAVCADSVTLSANEPYIGTGNWSVISGSGTFADASLNATPVSQLARGNNNFKWTITNGTCTSSSVVTITNNTPTVAEAGFDVSTCEDTVVLNPNTPTFGTPEWSVYSGSAKFNGNIAYDLGRDDNALVYTIRNANCSSSDTVVVTSHKPTTASLGMDVSVCGDSLLLVANAPVTGTGIWTLQSGSADLDDPASSTTMARNLQSGDNLLRWTITYLECSSYDEMTVSNDYVEADAGEDKIMCADRVVLEANDPQYSEGTWTLAGGSTGADILDPHSPVSVVENLAQGPNILRWTISKNSCVSYDEVTLTNNLPTQAFAGENVYMCNDEVQLRATVVDQGTGTWSVLSGYADISDLNDPYAMATNLDNGSNILRWTTEYAGCITTDEVIISNNQPQNVYAGLDQELCIDSTSLYANPPSIGSGSWSVIQGSAFIQDPSLYNSEVMDLGNGANTLKWTVATTGCSVSDTVVITNNLPSTALAGSDFAVCNSEGTLSANTPLYGIGGWSIVSGAGTFNDATSPHTVITGLALGNNLLRWTITNQNCTSTDDVYITNNSPTPADAGDDAEVCGPTAILYANSPLVGLGYWEVVSGTAIITDSTSYNTTLSELGFGNNTLRWTTVNGSCVTTDEVIITNNLADIYAGEDVVVYEPQAVLRGNNPTSGTSEWILIAGAGTIETPSYYTTNVSDLGAGLNTFAWTITNGSCTASDQMVVHYKVMPDVGFTVDQSEGCPGMVVSFTNTTQNGTTYSWNLGDGTNSVDVNPVHIYHTLGEYHVVLTAYGPDSRTVTTDTVITVHPSPIAEFQVAPDEIFVNKPMRCYDYSYNAAEYLWDFGDDNYSEDNNPVHYYTSGGEFTITLMVTSDHSCTDTVSHSIEVLEDGLIIFPNAFTPNLEGPTGGAYDENDRSNDVFHPYHENIETFHMEIYSRWGVMLFETDDVNIGWDGYYDGTLMDEDVYVWKASGTYISGTTFLKTGTVLLIR